MSLIACLFIVGVVSLLALAETVASPPDHFRVYNRNERSYRLFRAFLGIGLAILRSCGLSVAAIRVVLGVIAALSFGGIALVIFYLSRTAPPRAQRLRPKAPPMPDQYAGR